MLFKKSQAAMEFLLTYGWAILMVIVIITALAYFGVLDPTMLLPEKCVLQAGPLSCSDGKAYIFSSTNGQFHLKFLNSFDRAVRLEGMTLRKDGFECSKDISKTAASGSTICIPLFCENMPGRWSKNGFDMEVEYTTGEFVKTLSGDLYIKLDRTNPYQVAGCPMEPGDGNADGAIDPDDISFMMQYVIGRPPDESVFGYSAYDLDDDGFISGTDLIIMNNILIACVCCTESGNTLPLLEVARLYKEDNAYSIQQGCWTACGKKGTLTREQRLAEETPTCESYP